MRGQRNRYQVGVSKEARVDETTHGAPPLEWIVDIRAPCLKHAR